MSEEEKKPRRPGIRSCIGCSALEVVKDHPEKGQKSFRLLCSPIQQDLPYADCAVKIAYWQHRNLEMAIRSLSPAMPEETRKQVQDMMARWHEEMKEEDRWKGGSDDDGKSI
jgi:hypothetical protein